jgi:dTDP-glucose pyrophosphorylase
MSGCGSSAFLIFCVTMPFRLHPLTSDHGDEPCPKALLPVANKPMIDFPLTWLEQSGITGVFFVTLSLSWRRYNSVRGVARLSNSTSFEYLSPYSF